MSGFADRKPASPKEDFEKTSTLFSQKPPPKQKRFAAGKKGRLLLAAAALVLLLGVMIAVLLLFPNEEHENPDASGSTGSGSDLKRLSCEAVQQTGADNGRGRFILNTVR